jgi:PST family polysaccharide transporter
VGGRLLVLASTAILARLLSPSDFGLVALALMFMTLLDTVSDLGVGKALVIVGEDAVLERAETVFAISVAMGAVLTLVTAALGPVAAAFFHESELVAMFPVLGANFLLRSLGLTHYALAQKRIDFRSRTVAEGADVVLRGLTGIGLALAGAGAWSLVVGYLVGTAALTVTLWVLIPWRPKLRPRRAHVPGLLRFGGTLTAVDVATAVTLNVDYLFVGRVLGTNALGLYTLGFRLPELLIINLAIVASDVLFPAYAALGKEGIGRAYTSTLQYSLMIGLPLTAGLIVLAEPSILVLFGDRWRGAIDAMQVLALYGLSGTIGIPPGTAYKAIGRADVLLKLEIPRAGLLIGALFIFADEGIVAVAACQASVGMLFEVVSNCLAPRLLGVTPTRILAAVWRPLTATTGLVVVLLAVELLIQPHLLALITGILLGGTTYICLLWLVARDALRRLWETAFPRPAPAGDLLAVRETDVIA